jgi:hypothetical protein
MPAFVTSALTQAIGVVSRLGGLMYSAPVGFDPFATLDSGRLGGTVNSPGQVVGSLIDQSYGFASGGVPASPVGNDATQATLANKPVLTLGGSPHFLGLGFDGDNDLLATANLAATAQEVLIISARVNAIGPTREIASRWPITGTPGEIILQYSGSNMVVTYNNGTSQNIVAGTISANTPFVVTAIKGASSVSSRLNGVAGASLAGAGVAQVSACPFRLGLSGAAPGAIDGPIFAGFWVPGAPTAAEIEILERFAGICAGTVTA